ncbi:putative Lipoprotein [Vibrio chagasii]|nr:putative Lipoprotein [Vibrio chagasii]CAH7394212.1 putative Lipoprotein [Vibrio chagasii]CAH7398122.1 putative Lipoprotein [Vibrio chagasii]
MVFFFQPKCAMNPLKLFLLVATSIFLFGCAGGPIKTATKFTTYEDFQPGPDGGVDLVWARIGLRDADRLKSKLDDYDSVVIDQIFVLAMSTISKVATGEHTNVGSASVELLVSDAQDGTPLFAAIDREAGNKDFSTMIDSLDDAKDAINYWVERLGDTLQNIDDA